MNYYYRRIASLIISLTILFTSGGCSNKIIQALNSGDTGSTVFYEEVKVLKESGLLIVPVSINGKNYRFLFDTGAPFSISQELQEEFRFNRMANVRFSDTDGNSAKAEVVLVHGFQIQGVAFNDLGAFVLDMSNNPILKCMEIDGIVGSNMMRLCNWKIDMEKLLISFSNMPDSLSDSTAHAIPFYTNFQYDVILNLNFGSNMSTGGIKLDYGSNGYLSLDKQRFNYFNNSNLFDTTYVINGFTQSGVIGKKGKSFKKMAYCDKLSLGSLKLDSIIVKSGSSSMMGTSLLSRYIVGIDWTNNKLYMKPKDDYKIKMEIMGINISYAKEKGIYVLSVVEGSPAHKSGILPDMEIIQVDGVWYSSELDYCDIIDVWVNKKDSVSMSLRDETGKTIEVLMRKSILPFSAP